MVSTKASKTPEEIEEIIKNLPAPEHFGPTSTWDDCPVSHLVVGGPNMDIGSCTACWGPTGVMRPWGESFGWHVKDCSLPITHAGYCVGGGQGHEVPEGWKFRG